MLSLSGASTGRNDSSNTPRKMLPMIASRRLIGGVSSLGLLLWQQCPAVLMDKEYDATLVNANVLSTYRVAVG